ncbi:MAG TPA: M12 family metallo-peptidase [Thermoanaerobaculia bacterium]|nr:M12 family metallo-peptidase [Thermoanaerobaculia bacterium]
MIRGVVVRFAAAASVFVLSTLTAQASVVTKINEDALAPLREAGRSTRVLLDKLPLYDAERSVIELEEFQVWTPDAKVFIHGEKGVVAVDPPKARYFRGLVNGDFQSFAVFSVDEKTKAVNGLIVTRDKRYSVDSVARRRAGGGPQQKNAADEPAVIGGTDVYLTEAGEAEMIPGTDKPFYCELDKMTLHSPEDPTPAPRATGTNGQPVIAEGIAGAQSYEITLEIETDFELYQNAGSDATTATNYVTNLTAAVSTIYNRDLNTNVIQKALHLYTVAGDPWAAGSTGLTGLNDLAAYYHSASRPAGRTTSAVAMLSGKDYGGGIAYEGVICTNDFGTGPYGGPYSWSGGIGRLFGAQGLGSIPDPDATNSAGTAFGTPAGLQNYWPLIEYAHELGHNMGGHHTHCAQVSDAERTASGFTDGSAASSANNQIDHCYGDEDALGLSNCYVGSNYVVGSQGIFKGTIMSYCHNVFASAIPQSRFLFGVDGEPSVHQYDDYMLRAAGPVSFPSGDGRDGGSNNIVDGVGTFTMTTITAPAELVPESTGNIASVTAANAGCCGAVPTYAWSITNGVITAGQGTSSITFTAGATGETVLKASAYKTTFCGITETKSVPIEDAVVFEPPVNVFATATSATTVDISWAAVIGATHYQVYRAQQQGGFGTLVGTTTSTTLTDSTALANTAYQYVVTAGDGVANWSVFSDDDVAVTVVFTDPTLTASSTKVKLVHFTELLTAVNALNTLIGSSTIGFTAPAPTTSVTVRRQHLLDLRTALTAARAVLGFPAVTFTDAPPTAQSTRIKAVHINELRGGVL